MVPISYEFRFFCFEGKCVGYGPYWNMGTQYSLAPEDREEAHSLAEWAADRVGAEFVAVDIAKTAQGQWLVIEVNDVQESGYAGVNPLVLWKNTIEAAQERTWIPVEDMIPEGAVIMGSEPDPNLTIEDMRQIISQIDSEQALADAYAIVHNKFWYIEDDLYDYEKGTDAYNRICAVVDAWGDMMHELSDRVRAIMETSTPPQMIEAAGENKHIFEPFMRQFGYRDARGWWVKA